MDPLRQSLPPSFEACQFSVPEVRQPAPAGSFCAEASLLNHEESYELKRLQLGTFFRESAMLAIPPYPAFTFRAGMCCFLAKIVQDIQEPNEDPRHLSCLPIVERSALLKQIQVLLQSILLPIQKDIDYLAKESYAFQYVTDHCSHLFPCLRSLSSPSGYTEFFDKPIAEIMKEPVPPISQNSFLQTVLFSYACLLKAKSFVDLTGKSSAFSMMGTSLEMFLSLSFPRHRLDRLTACQKRWTDLLPEYRATVEELDQHLAFVKQVQERLLRLEHSFITRREFNELGQSCMKISEKLIQCFTNIGGLFNDIVQVLPKSEEYLTECPPEEQQSVTRCNEMLALASESFVSDFLMKRLSFTLILAMIDTLNQAPLAQRQIRVREWALAHGLSTPEWQEMTVRQVICNLLSYIVRELFVEMHGVEGVRGLPILRQRNIVVWMKNIIELLARSGTGNPQPVDLTISRVCLELEKILSRQFPWIEGLSTALSAQELFDQSLGDVCCILLPFRDPVKILEKVAVSNKWLISLQPPIEHIEEFLPRVDCLFPHVLVHHLLDPIRLPLEISRARRMRQRQMTWQNESESFSEAAKRYCQTFDEKQFAAKASSCPLEQLISSMREVLQEYQLQHQSICTKAITCLDEALRLLPSEEQFLQEYPDKRATEAAKLLNRQQLTVRRKQIQDAKGALFFKRLFAPVVFALFDQDMQMVCQLPHHSSKAEIERVCEIDTKELEEILASLEVARPVTPPRAQRARHVMSPPPPPSVSVTLPPRLDERADSAFVALAAAPPVIEPSDRLLECVHAHIRSREPHDIPSAFPFFAALHRNLLIGPTGRLSPPMGMSTMSVGHISTRMKGVCNHLYLGACGLELIGKLLAAQRSDLMNAIIPTWMADRYLVSELHGDVQSLLSRNEQPSHHSLLELEGFLSHGRKLPDHLHEYIVHLSEGIIWYRYGASLTGRDQAGHSSELYWLNVCNKLAIDNQAMDERTRMEFLEFVAQKQHASYELMYHTLSATSSDEGLERVGTVIGDYLQRWKTVQKGCVCASVQAEPSLLLVSMRQLVERARACYQTLERRIPNSKKARLLREIVLHVVRLQHTLEVAELFPLTHLFSFYYRNVLNAQWLLEHVYKLACYLHHLPIVQSHKFEEYEESLSTIGEARILPPLEELREYNSGVSLHYESLSQLPLHPFEQYQRMLEHDSLAVLSEDGFTHVSMRPFDSKACFQERANHLVGLLIAKLLPFFDQVSRQ